LGLGALTKQFLELRISTVNILWRIPQPESTSQELTDGVIVVVTCPVSTNVLSRV